MDRKIRFFNFASLICLLVILLFPMRISLADDETPQPSSNIGGAGVSGLTEEELEAAVYAYIDMLQKEANGESFKKKSYYIALSEKSVSITIFSFAYITSTKLRVSSIQRCKSIVSIISLSDLAKVRSPFTISLILFIAFF